MAGAAPECYTLSQPRKPRRHGAFVKSSNGVEVEVEEYQSCGGPQRRTLPNLLILTQRKEKGGLKK
jgi:hypothetical protein